MNIFSKRQLRSIWRLPIILAVVSMSVYAQEAAAPSTGSPATPGEAAPIPERPIVDSTSSVNDITGTTGSAGGSADSVISADSRIPDTLTDPAAVTTAATTANTTATPVQPPAPVAGGPAAAKPAASSNYYGGQAAVYTGAGRGMASRQPAGSDRRARIIDTTPSIPRNVDSTRNPAAAAPDSLPTQLSKAGSGATTPALASKAPRNVKIIAALTTTAAIGGIITFVLAKKLSGSDEETRQRIPDPPAPPGY